MLLCGMHENVITPPLGSIIPGYFNGRRGTGILDDLYAKAIVFDDGHAVIALVAVDLIDVSSEQVAVIRGRVYQYTGILPENIMVSATHTHTGGPVAKWGSQIWPDPAYIDYYTARAADAVTMAYKKRRACAIGHGSGSETRLAFNRRYLLDDGTIRTNPGGMTKHIVRPDGPVDSEVGVVRIDSVSGEPIGIITNFACHLDTVEGTEISGDYPGELSRRLKDKLGRQVVSLFLTGACGNINHINFMQEKSVRTGHHLWMGGLLAEEVMQVWEGIQTSGECPLLARRRSITVRRRQPGASEKARAQETLDGIPFDENLLAGFDARQIDRFYAEVMLGILGDRHWRDPVRVDIQVFGIGDMGLFAIPGEYFVEFGLGIKSRSPMQFNMINTLANGDLGYIPTRNALSAGGYESRLCYSSCLEENAGYLMEDEAIRLING